MDIKHLVDGLIAGINSEISIERLLRQCQTLAFYLKDAKFSDWINKEQNGYDDTKELPEYRQIPCQIKANISTFGGLVTNYPIPAGISGDPEKDKIMFTMFLSNPLGEIEQMTDNSDTGASIEHPLNAYACGYLNNFISNGGSVQNSWQTASKQAVKSVCDRFKSQLLDFLLKMNVIDGKNVKVQLKSMSIFRSNDFNVDSKKCFIVMPFNPDEDKIYNDVIKPLVESCGLECFRADEIYNNKAIVEDIWRSINESGIIIADLSGRNANVFYELGLAHAIGKEVILIAQKEDDFPFDLRHLRHIVYQTSYDGVPSFKKTLAETIKAVLSYTIP